MLVVVDGMRSDIMLKTNHSFLDYIEKNGLYTWSGTSVFPPVTLPVHFSMFHGVAPQRHGILSNLFTPQVRPVKGICELLFENKKTSALFYGWEHLRDLANPGCWKYMQFYNMSFNPDSDVLIQRATIKYLEQDKPDFVFCYLGETDDTGHAYGFGKKEYQEKINRALGLVKELYEKEKDNYDFLILADHGGHDQTHGDNIPEDMTVPIVLLGEDIEPGIMQSASVIDVAPTVAAILGIEPDKDWKGKSLYKSKI